MSLLTKYETCRGLTLFKWGRWRIELWYIPAGYTIIEHCHPAEDVELIHVFGASSFFRRDLVTWKLEQANVKWFSFLKHFTIRHYHSHWFKVCRTPMIFINFQKFFFGVKPVSAAKDFSVTNKEFIES